MVGEKLRMTAGQDPDAILAESINEDEWEDQPERIETRPSGTQVISARLPTQVAEELLAEAVRRRIKPSELVREAVENLLHPSRAGGVTVSAYRLRVVSHPSQYLTENPNPVVESEPDSVYPADRVTAAAGNRGYTADTYR
jgi:hypothetical protein